MVMTAPIADFNVYGIENPIRLNPKIRANPDRRNNTDTTRITVTTPKTRRVGLSLILENILVRFFI
jgi:hypothetical protein